SNNFPVNGLFSPYPGQSCADAPVFTPSSLVVQYGANASAACAVCRTECNGTLFGLEIPLGVKKVYGTTLQWEVDNMTEWETSAMCYYNHRSDGQCVTVLPVTVYREHTLLSMFSFVDADPAAACGQYTLHCVTHNVAPIGRLVVTFYRGQTVLGRLTSNSTEKKPVTETFSLKVNHSRDDSGALIRCEAELQLGPEGPRPPPVVTSYSIAAPTNCETKKKKRNLLLHETIKLRLITTVSLESISTQQPPKETTAGKASTTKPEPNSGASYALIHWCVLCFLPFLSVLN
uniref:Intercellular adhesion molecule N-terminal domain-containing protein n=1 Tax=Salarias fasciatus TaxID=181472 RepID=A0A672GA29_SALFA